MFAARSGRKAEQWLFTCASSCCHISSCNRTRSRTLGVESFAKCFRHSARVSDYVAWPNSGALVFNYLCEGRSRKKRRKCATAIEKEPKRKSEKRFSGSVNMKQIATASCNGTSRADARNANSELLNPFLWTRFSWRYFDFFGILLTCRTTQVENGCTYMLNNFIFPSDFSRISTRVSRSCRMQRQSRVEIHSSIFFSETKWKYTKWTKKWCHSIQHFS